MIAKFERENMENHKFDEKADNKLLNMVNKFGKKWKLITQYFSGKSLN